MPVKESSFRIGSGRYVQGVGILNTIGSEILRVGSAPLIVGGKTALSITRETISKSVSAVCDNYSIEEHLASCNDEDAKKYAGLAKAEGYDVIVGVGGGVIMDFAKLIGHFANLPVINVPTSSATCAAYTPLSVRYTREGRTVGSLHYDREVNGVIVDTEILMNQPPRLFLAGVFDAIAKFVEIKHFFSINDSGYCPLGLDWAYAMSAHSYKELNKKTEPCLLDMKSKNQSELIEEVAFTTIAATGVISGIARGSNQTAVAHKFYEATRVIFWEESRGYLHGEIVGIGLLLQNAFNGEKENNRELLALMKKYGMPHSISDVGIKDDKETMLVYFDTLKKIDAIKELGEGAPERLYAALEYLWSLG